MFWLIACLTPIPIVTGPAQCTLYADADQDGYGDPERCLPPGTSTGVDNGDDCDDQDSTVHPGAEEICDGVDQDCDLIIDDDAVDAGEYWVDADGDSYGDPGRKDRVCPMEGWAPNGEDCDDGDPSIYPGAPEFCDEEDRNCNGDPYDNPDDGRKFYLDKDGDGYGRKQDFTEELCEAPSGYVSSDADCDDDNPDVNPGQTYFFEYPTDSGSFDYDCNEKEEKGYPYDPVCDADDNLVVDGFAFGPPNCGNEALFADYCFFGTALGAFDYRVQPCR